MTALAQNPQRVSLHAGALSCVFDGATLGHLCWDGRPIVRLVYAAVRDREWGTVEPHIANLEITRSDESFRVEFDAAYVAADVDFRGHCSFSGRSDGTAQATFDGAASREFDYARIGLCVLLPWEHYCGRPYRAALREATAQGVIPERIAEQYFIDGCYAPSIGPFTTFETPLDAATTVAMAFEGDEFEMEDQRNWTDSTLKIYSTPLHLGNLHHAEAGKRIRQVVKIAVASKTETHVPAAARREAVDLRLGAPSGNKLPALGTTWPRSPDDNAPPLALIDGLHLSHVRVELDLTRRETMPVGRQAVPAGCGIELAVWTDQDGLEALSGAIGASPAARIDRVIVNDAASDVTPPSLIAAASRVLGEAGRKAPVGGGTDFWFAEINRSDQDFRALDFLSFTISPQLHVFDDESIWETLVIQEQVIQAAKRRIDNGRIVVSPITLIPRDPARVRRRQAQPPDRRHTSAFLAAWTAASIGHATAAGAEALTYFDLFGPHGLLQHAAAADRPGFMPTPAGLVLQALGRAVGEPHFAVHSDAPEAIYAFGSGRPPRATITIVNCKPEPVVACLLRPVAPLLSIRRLARHDIAKGRWRAGAMDEAASTSSVLRIELSGHEVVQIALGEGET